MTVAMECGLNHHILVLPTTCCEAVRAPENLKITRVFKWEERQRRYACLNGYIDSKCKINDCHFNATNKGVAKNFSMFYTRFLIC